MKRKIFKDLDTFFEETGTSQAAFAQSLGVTQTCISLIRNKKRTPRPRLLRAIAKLAGIPAETLVVETSESDNE